jgi:acyl carrier protein
MTKAEILSKLKEEITKETGLKREEISDSATFASLGLDSISSVVILDKLEKHLKVEMNPMVFWDYPTVELLAEYVTSLKST